MKVYKTKLRAFGGTNYREVSRKATDAYDIIKKKTKRRPYVRSAYFNKEKVFLGVFWSHLRSKNYWDQIRRMRFFECGVELIMKSRIDPMTKENPNKPDEVLHRFSGVTSDGEQFNVQIKENKRSGQKMLISVFPIEK